MSGLGKHLVTSGTLEAFVAADDLSPLEPLSTAEWDRIRHRSGRLLARQFCTLRNLWVHRGRFAKDAMGFAWGGIYRTLLVGSIVRTSYRNEGHFRSDLRIVGTSDFFTGGFVLERGSEAYAEIIRMVNLRHHVAGVARPVDDATGRVQVEPGYEADYAYVATSFIESIRRGLAMCGVRLESPQGQQSSEDVCTVLYHLAGFTGLTRRPRDLAAHERFRDAYDRSLRENPSSARTRRMAQEIARRIIPLTAAKCGLTVRGHLQRHVDAETAEFLFPGGVIPQELETRRKECLQQPQLKTTPPAIRHRSALRQKTWQRADIAALQQAYLQAASDKTDDRLIGAILLHALESEQPLERRTVDLAAGEPLIRQGDVPREMYVVLEATTPLQVERMAEAEAVPLPLATLEAPTVLGEIGMWRGQPAMATVRAQEASRLDILVIDADRFETLKQESGFRAATAAEVQRRLAMSPGPMLALIDEQAEATGDERLASIAQLMWFLTGHSHQRLDRVIDLPEDATPSELVDGLRKQVAAAVAAGGLSPTLERSLTTVMAAIG